MSSLTIAHTEILQLDGFYSLNALHKASGGKKTHQCSNFIRLDKTQELITEINHSSDMKNGAIKRVQGGIPSNQGTYVCKELVYAYAMWISPKFNLMVIRAFDALQTTAQPAKEVHPLLTQITRLKDQLAQQNEMLELYRFKAGALEQQSRPSRKRESKGPLTPAERTAIIEMHWEGLSRSEIAKKTGRSVSGVYTVLREYKAGVAA